MNVLKKYDIIAVENKHKQKVMMENSISLKTFIKRGNAGGWKHSCKRRIEFIPELWTEMAVGLTGETRYVWTKVF